MRTIQMSNNYVAFFAASCDGRWAATSKVDNSFPPDPDSLQLWDLAGTSDKPVAIHQPPGRHLQFSRGSRWLVADHGGIVIYSVPKLKVVSEIPARGQCLFTLDNRELVVVSPFTKVTRWDTQRWQALPMVNIKVDLPSDDDLYIDEPDISADGSQLALPHRFLSEGIEVRLWDYPAGERYRVLKTGKRIVYQVRFSPDGSKLAGWVRGGVLVWDIRKCRQVVHLKPVPNKHRDFTVRAACFTPDSQHLAVGCQNTVRFFRVTDWKETRCYDWGVGDITHLSFTTDGTRGIAASVDAIVVWDMDV